MVQLVLVVRLVLVVLSGLYRPWDLLVLRVLHCLLILVVLCCPLVLLVLAVLSGLVVLSVLRVLWSYDTRAVKCIQDVNQLVSSSDSYTVRNNVIAI